ncbi:putative Late nodulin [Medicago truncatula]|uniref:Putative Late nodulin n=1 Tax=Medicago truncatula TaxID=3880 RepID=A0A396GVD3_MEDTR|nr:putative Late nodulin [Medicago truncatula]
MKSIINYKAITPYSISYMQKRENMTVIVKFVCVMIIFLSLCVFSMHIETVTTCIYDSDCPEDMCYPPKKSFCSTFEILSIERKVGVCECI